MPRGRKTANQAGAAAAPGGREAAGRSRLGRRGRGRRRAGSDGRLAEIVARYVGSLVEAVRAEVRRSVADEVRDVLTGSRVAGLTAGRSRRAGVRRRVLPCIKPGCNNPSKGPRFHYLCDEHKDAKRSDYEAWRKARKEKQAA